jgi:multidrug efflux pump subunit AcrA (membrane-fusion protein)
MISSENGLLLATVLLNVQGRDVGSFVQEARASVAREVVLPPGYYIGWSGRWENQERARQRLQIVLPIVLLLEAHDRALQRTQKLVEIGAASRQELERSHAEHAAQTAEVESARSRLQLLGAADLDETASSNRDAAATTNVPAPIDGVITERLANVGLNVDPATKLFTIVDPLNEPVAIEFTPSKAGEIAFACGMSMLHGTVVVE